MIAFLVPMKSVCVDSEGHGIIEDELRLLARVTTALSTISSGTAGAPDFDTALIELRDQIAESKPEDIAALVEQMMRISAVAQRYGKGRALPVNPESPYFAHLRLEEGERVRDVLIGKRGFIDRERDVQIVDWRNAPVSRIYYRYEEGDDYEEVFANKSLEGWVQARRSLTIDEAKLRRIGCPQGTYISREEDGWFEAASVSVPRLAGGQGAAARPTAVTTGGRKSRLGVHSGPVLRADKHLPEIAALIDAEQFGLITRPESGLVVLQGGAGSGKTTVALHRVAYLNYSMPGRFKGKNMMVVVLTKAMVRYVQHVLPSLGVKGVTVTTAERWFARARRRTVPQAPDVYTDDTPAEVLRFKKHPMMIELLAEQVQAQVRQAGVTLEQALDTCPDGDLVLELWHRTASLLPVQRCVRLRNWLKEEGHRLDVVTAHRAATTAGRLLARMRDALADWGEVLTDRALLSRAVAERCPGEFSERELDTVCDWCARQLEGSIQKVSAPGADNPFAALGSKKDPDPYISLDGHDERPVSKPGYLDRPDDALLAYLVLLKRGGLTQPMGGQALRYEHLVVDEAQDLSALEIKVLLQCTSKLRSITLAGDTAQRMVFDNKFSDWESLLRRVDAPEATTRTLRLGYRSTQQIMDLAQSLVGELPHNDLAATRAGTSVELFRFGEQGEAVAMLAEALRSLALREPMASVALITRHATLARIYARALTRSEVPGIRLVANQEFSFRAGIEVTDVSQVKGLEFDYVILLDVTADNYPDTLESRHLLHIAATRAAHQLWLVSLGQSSPLIPEQMSEEV